MTSIDISFLDELMKKYYVPPSKRIVAIYVHEGTRDPRNPRCWRNRLKGLFERLGIPISDGGSFAGDIPLVVSPNVPAGKILIEMGDKTLRILDEQEGEQ